MLISSSNVATPPPLDANIVGRFTSAEDLESKVLAITDATPTTATPTTATATVTTTTIVTSSKDNSLHPYLSRLSFANQTTTIVYCIQLISELLLVASTLLEEFGIIHTCPDEKRIIRAQELQPT